MASLTKKSGVDVTIQPDSNCGNPCHPAHVCNSCAPFWKAMLETGRFQAYVPPTFEGPAPAPPQEPNFFDRNVDLAGLKLRSKGAPG
jgi:ribosomal protein L32